MSRVYPTAGSKLFIGPAKVSDGTDYTFADFNGLTWTEITGITNLGGTGDQAELISSNHINNARTRKAKGVRNSGQMQVVADLDFADAGQLAVIAAERNPYTYAFRLQYVDAPAPRSATATMTIAGPAVVTWANHGLAAGDKVRFSTSGALPTGITANTEYFVIAAGLTSGAFQLSATAGGSAITTTGTQSGTHTVTTVPTASQRCFTALVMSAVEQLDEANSTKKLNITLELDSNVARQSATPAA